MNDSDLIAEYLELNKDDPYSTSVHIILRAITWAEGNVGGMNDRELNTLIGLGGRLLSRDPDLRPELETMRKEMKA